MKRITLILCFVVSLICLLIGTVFAHPGRTDSKGGHTNHSTGEYHYHHGYSAHDLYDMDSDGVVDCPYDFDDKTDHSQKDTATSPTSSSIESVPKPSEESVSVRNKGSILNWLRTILVFLILPAIVLALIFGFRLSVWISIEIRKLFNISEGKENAICFTLMFIFCPALVFLVVWGISSI